MGTVRFLLDGDAIEVADPDPTATLLDHLRYRLRRTGTKEGCAEGDCGACTVLVGERDGNAIAWRAVNACILFLPMLHGRALMTVESLSRVGSGGTGESTPLQALMAANGSSQCGFCTPGFVMALHGRSIGARGSELPVADVLAGNLCRCTGYGPLLAAAEATQAGTGAAARARDAAATLALLDTIAAGEPSGTCQGHSWYAPRSLDALDALLAEHPDARLVAGATDVGLWVTKGLRTLGTVVFLGDVAGLRGIVEDAAGLTLGAGVRWADAHPALARLHPDVGELVRRFAGLQVRNAATIGGNIANGSPIGDGPPALIALGATLTLRGPAGRREMPLEDFFLDYGRQDRLAGEYVERIHVPRPAPGDIVHISKLSKRFDSDISAVCGAFRLSVAPGSGAGGMITAARVAFGGMAATPRRAPRCEAALAGAPFTPATLARAAAALRQDFAPLSDLRGSAAYRLDVATALLERLWLRAAGEPATVLECEAVLCEVRDG